LDLNDQAPGDYQVCVYNSGFINTCGLTFTVTNQNAGTNKAVTTSAVITSAGTSSSVYFDTNPSGATVYLDNIEIGTSGFTYKDAIPGTHQVLIRKTGYNDYSGSVTVPDDQRVTFSADLIPLGSDTSAAPAAATPVAAGTAIPVNTVTTIKKSSAMKVPTTWPGDTPPEASSMDPSVIIGTGCLALIALRKH
jgi:hypothetical protein